MDWINIMDEQPKEGDTIICKAGSMNIKVKIQGNVWDYWIKEWKHYKN